MDKIFNGHFRRRFSVNLYKNLRYPMGEMSFYKDFTRSAGRGDAYPLLSSEGEISESVGLGKYRVTSENGGACERLIGEYFPYASYEILISELSGEAGISFFRNGGDRRKAEFFVSGKAGEFKVGWRYFENGALVSEEFLDKTFEKVSKLLVTCRGANFDVYISDGGVIFPVKVVYVAGMWALADRDVMAESFASLFCKLGAEGIFETDKVSFFLDSGISQADIRPLKYEDGSLYTENGRLFFTMSIREEESGYQGVLSWDPSGCDFKLEGAIFFDVGDGKVCNDVASAVRYDRESGRWLIWYCSFSHGHVLAHGVSLAPLCHGINIIDATLMPAYTTVESTASAGDTALGMVSGTFGKATLPDDTLFFAKFGDEDPDFLFDKKQGKWIMTVCRGAKEAGGKYRYFRFESSDPFTGYTFCERTLVGENTGGSLVNLDGEFIFVCGSDFANRAVYYAFRLGQFDSPEKLVYDYDDGGFRGWGTIVTVPSGSRMKTLQLTFDRHNGSKYNWSYGNIHCFEFVPEK